MLADKDRDWLKALDAELYPPKDSVTRSQRRAEAVLGTSKHPPPSKVRDVLTDSEVKRIFLLVEEAPLFTCLFSHGCICGLGVRVYEHEMFPGTGPQLLLSIKDDHIRWERTAYDYLLGKSRKERAPGSVSPEAWAMFTTYTHSKKNREWITMYKLNMKFDQQSYDY